MNKKFSTLVAALLVSGVSYAVVGTFNSPALTNSPIAKAAAANVNLRSAANYSVAPIAYEVDATKWSWAGKNLQTTNGSVLAYKDGEVILLNDNLPVVGATKIDFSYADYHLETKVVGGVDYVLAFNRATHALSLQPKATIDLDTYYYATLYLDASTRPDEASIVPCYIAEEVKNGAISDKSAIVTASTFTPAKTTTFSGGVSDVSSKLTVTNIEVVESGSAKFLKFTSAKGSTVFLNVDASGNISYTSSEPTSLDIASSNVTVTGEGYVLVGGKHLEYGSSISLENSHNANNALYLLPNEGDDVAKTTVAEGLYYLLRIDDGFSAASTGGNIVTFSTTGGTIVASATPAIATPAQQITLTWNDDNSAFTLSQGLDYLKNDASLGEVGDAAEFKLSPEDGAVMLGNNYLLRAISDDALSIDASVTPGTNEKVYLFSATEAASKPETAPVGGEVLYVLANATFTVSDLDAQYVIEATEDAGTPDVPDAGAMELINAANYFINDGTNYLAYKNGKLVNDASHSESDQTEMWIATEHKGAKGEPTTYSFVNRSTEAGKLAFKVEFKNNAFPAEATFDAAKGTYTQFFIDKDGKVSFTAKATDKTGKAVEQVYYLNWNGTTWSFIKDNSNVQNIKFVQTAEGMSLDADYLNKKAGNGSDFSFLFAENAKRDSLKPLDETVLSKTIVAVDASDYNNVFKSYTSNDNYSTYSITEGMLFSSSVSNASKETGIKRIIENFRASKFIIVDPTAYSAIIEDKDNNQFFDYMEVSGSDLVDENGILLADPNNYNTTNADIKDEKALAGVKYVFSNAIFKAQQRQGAQYTDPVYVTTPSAYYNPEANEDGLAGYEEATELAVAVKKFQGTYYVGAAKNTQNVTPRWEYVYIGTNNDVTYKQVYGIVNIYNAKYNTKGEVYGNTASGIAKLDTKYITVNMNAPEGQFLVNYANNKFTFTNRESGETAFNGSYGLKTVKDAKGNVIKDVYAVANGTDTVKIVLALPETIYDGYKNFDQKKYELTDSIYTMSFQPKVDGQEGLNRVYVAENHDTDHMLTLTTDNEDAAKFSMVKFEGKKDTVYVSTGKYITSDGKLVDDKAVAFAYTIYNDDNSEYVEYNNAVSKEFFFCNWNKKVNEEPLKQNAQRYILKDKGNNNYQLIAISYADKDQDANTFNVLKDAKAYGAFQAPKISQEANIYKVTDNDIINISVIGAPMYRTVEAAPFDTIRIYKEGSKNVALYAESAKQEIVSGSNFLAMGHNADVNTAVTKFSLFVDTAYVRDNTNKPQYMLVIEPDTVHGKYVCNIPTHEPHDSGKIDTVYGKFLLTMIDSIPAWGNKHNNPYYWEEKQYPRLGFVNAKHYGDSLVILNDNGIQHANDTINLNDNSNKFGVYAFRIVNDDTKAFIIETAYDRKEDGSFSTGWIKWLNGVPVVIPNSEKDKAEIFSLEATSNDPVANEAIATSSIKVIAGNGVVTVIGAQGKQVAITNVLGQTIANTVLSSSEATIAAPAGIVVVAVEGEAAVKAIIK